VRSLEQGEDGPSPFTRRRREWNSMSGAERKLRQTIECQGKERAPEGGRKNNRMSRSLDLDVEKKACCDIRGGRKKMNTLVLGQRKKATCWATAGIRSWCFSGGKKDERQVGCSRGDREHLV